MITKEEYLELKKLYNDGYRWIARDSCEIIYAYKLEPIKLAFSWKYSKNNMATTCGDDFLLPYVYVKWEDVKPTSIVDLINEYEAHKLLVGEKVKVTVPQSEDEPLYYALIKGHELSSNEFTYWRCNAYNSGDLFIGSKSPKDSCINRMTKNNWNKLGISSSNADFVVE